MFHPPIPAARFPPLPPGEGRGEGRTLLSLLLTLLTLLTLLAPQFPASAGLPIPDHVLTDSGIAQRLDFGVSVDTHGDGVPDGWQLATLGTVESNLKNDSDGDRAADAAEYSAGTAPRDATDTFRLGLQRDGSDLLVTLRALAATGPGYEGRRRFYAIEVTTDPLAGTWQILDNHSRIPGKNQLLTYREPANSEGPRFYRARVWLEGP